jgi:hypothetical protein
MKCHSAVGNVVMKPFIAKLNGHDVAVNLLKPSGNYIFHLS